MVDFVINFVAIPSQCTKLKSLSKTRNSWLQKSKSRLLEILATNFFFSFSKERYYKFYYINITKKVVQNSFLSCENNTSYIDSINIYCWNFVLITKDPLGICLFC